MRQRRAELEAEGFPTLESSVIEVLTRTQERLLLQQLADCKAKLARALAEIKGVELPAGADDSRSLSAFIAAAYTKSGSNGARLGVVFRQYSELRSKLALANLRLVAHLAKRFRNRGVLYSDLMQEGFCGLLEAIDRFDLNHPTKLATYATWWIRQSLQQAVASSAYPVRLTPRHLRQLAQCQDQIKTGQRSNENPEEAGARLDSMPQSSIDRILTATRPALSFDSAGDCDPRLVLKEMMSEEAADRLSADDSVVVLDRLLQRLFDRERQVLSLRFGLKGKSRHSLSQVGRVLGVSKERVRQIQDRALQKLRALADEEKLGEEVIFP